MRPKLLALAVLALVPACKSEAPEPTQAAAATEQAPEESVEPSATAAPQARAVNEETKLYSFDYAYPAEAAAIPALRAILEEDLAGRRAKLAAESRKGKTEIEGNGGPFNPWSSSMDWKVVTDLPGWISLSSTVGSFTGGAHPNYWFKGILWDKSANQQREVASLFTSRQDLAKAITGPFCDALDREREKKREVPVTRDPDDWMSACIDPLEQTLILGSSDRTRFDRIGILVAPYAAGPYVEGDYEVTLPVTAAVLAAVKPEFRQSFSARR